jgi:type IV pilus assembly protein PilO
MTNFQPRPSLPLGLTSERLLVLAPALAGGLLSVVLLAALVVPLLRGVLQRQDQLGQLQQQADELPQNLRLSARARLDLEKAERQQQRLLQLVAGTGQLDTLLAQLGAEATRAGVDLDSYEPQAAAPVPAATAPGAPPPPPAGAKPGTPPVPPDPLLVPGLQKRSQLLVASGRFPQLLTFLRRLEQLAPLGVVSDLNLKHEPVPKPPPEPAPGQKAAPPSTQSPAPERTTLRFTLTAYSRVAAGAPRK